MAKMVSLELDDEHKLDAPQPIPMAAKPDYPYGMRICLTHVEMAKLGLDPDCKVGDVLDCAARAVVTNVNHSQSEDGSECCRVELQIQEMSVEDYE
jgi:hypothetical protein